MDALTWDPDFYLTGYEGFESPESFPTRSALDDYRRLLMARSAHQVDAISRYLGGRRIRVVELCSGNGRLIVGLALAGLLDHGIGIEISQSRTAFAKAWAQDLGLSNVEFVAADVLSLDPAGFKKADLAVCLTGAFDYFDPIDPAAPSRVLDMMAHLLLPGGTALFELYELTRSRRSLLQACSGHVRTWEPLPLEDRFAYYLDELIYSDNRRILKHGKTFIGRDGSIDDGRIEVLRFYAVHEFQQMLGEAGFGRAVVFGDFQGGPYVAEATGRLVAWVTLAQSLLRQTQVTPGEAP